MIAVAGDRVDAAEFIFGVGQHLSHRLQCAGDESATIAAVRIGQLSQMRCGGRGVGVGGV